MDKRVTFRAWWLPLLLIIFVAATSCSDSKKKNANSGTITPPAPIIQSPPTNNGFNVPPAEPIDPYFGNGNSDGFDDDDDDGDLFDDIFDDPVVNPIDPDGDGNPGTNEDILDRLESIDTRLARDEELAAKAFGNLQDEVEGDTWDKITKYGFPIFLGLTAVGWLRDMISATAQTGSLGDVLLGGSAGARRKHQMARQDSFAKDANTKLEANTGKVLGQLEEAEKKLAEYKKSQDESNSIAQQRLKQEGEKLVALTDSVNKMQSELARQCDNCGADKKQLREVLQTLTSRTNQVLGEAAGLVRKARGEIENNRAQAADESRGKAVHILLQEKTRLAAMKGQAEAAGDPEIASQLQQSINALDSIIINLTF